MAIIDIYTVGYSDSNDYCRLADIQIDDCGSEWKCVFSSETVPLDILVSEFDNYLIELSQLHINV